ncbi:MAG: hypothetical protein GY757_01245 [bacterium]|nr:hypothetical protein [bacterium]
MSPGIKDKNRAAFNSEISRRLEEVRHAAHYTVPQMAKAMGIKGATYLTNIKGTYTPTLQGLCRLADSLKVSLDWLLKGRGSMFCKNAPVFKGVDSYSDEKEEMEALMEKLPLVRHSVMGYYQKFKLENMELINRALNKDNASRDGASG